MQSLEHLCEAVRIPTVSSNDPALCERSHFERFQAFLRKTYPRTFSALSCETFEEVGILLYWQGKESTLKPVLLLSHYDVVPADDSEEAPWEHPPFSGYMDEQHIWGRGTLDVKSTLIAIMETVEELIGQGFTPFRGLYMAFGGDEETNGKRGAARMAERLRKQGLRFAYILDEGSIIAEGMLSFVKHPLALIGVAEKGHADIRITARGREGHASMPPRLTVADILARALVRLNKKPFPTRITYAVKEFLRAVGKHSSLPLRFLLTNPWLTALLVKLLFAGNPTTNALIRTTMAPTMLKGSDKENVLPEKVQATINVRILPGETVASTLESIRRKTRHPGISVDLLWPDSANDPQPESPAYGFGYDAIVAALKHTAPEAVPVPFLVTACTDSHHYGDMAEAVYRFMPVILNSAQIDLIHGKNERISKENFMRCLTFYHRLIRFSLGHPTPHQGACS